jgi:hypothetical protein
MPINELIIVLSNSTLDFDSSILPQLWLANKKIPEQVIDKLLTALENSSEDHPDILEFLLAECGKATIM